MYRYLALPPALSQSHAALKSNDSLRVFHLRGPNGVTHCKVYVSADTPVVQISPSTVLVGHTFQRSDDSLIESRGAFTRIRDQALPDHLIRDCWGEYVLLQALNDDGFSVMRDPSGGAGCVYASDGSFVTSDISLAHRAGLHTPRVNWDFIQETLTYPHMKTGRTGLIGIEELLPGCQLRVVGRQTATKSLWSPWDFVTADSRYDDGDVARRAVRQAVSRCVKALAKVDGSILLELSGGLDSSIVAACLLESDVDVACCNLITPVPGADERIYAQQMSDLLGVQLHVEALSIERAEFNFQPPPHSVSPSTWLLQHASNEIKESMGERLGVHSYYSGGGGDTVFGFTKSAAPAVDALKSRGLGRALMTIRDLAELHQCTVWKVAHLTMKKLLGPEKPPRRPDPSFLTFKLDVDAYTLHPWFSAPHEALPGDRERVFDLAGNQVFRDGLARGGTRKLRMPLLSQPIMETCFRVPGWMWFAGGHNRAIAREAFADLLPPDILHRRSKGTFMNYTGAVYRRNIPRLRDYLLTGQLAEHGLLDSGALRKFLDSNPDTQGDGFMRIFDLCEVENWLRHQLCPPGVRAAPGQSHSSSRSTSRTAPAWTASDPRSPATRT